MSDLQSYIDAGIWGKKSHLAIQDDPEKVVKELEKLKPKLDEYVEIKNNYDSQYETFLQLSQHAAFPTKEESKGLHRSKDSIEKKVVDLKKIAYSNRASVKKLTEQIEKFNQKATDAVNDNQVVPVLMEGMQLKKNIDIWRTTLKTSGVFDEDYDNMLQTAQKAYEDHTAYDAGQLLKKIKQKTTATLTKVKKVKKPKTSKPKVSCRRCKELTKDIIQDICLTCFKVDFNKRLKILRAKESNYEGDVEQYSNISVMLEEGLATFNKTGKLADANAMIPTLETCERILLNIEYNEQDLSSSSEHDMEPESSDEVSNYDPSDVEDAEEDDEEFEDGAPVHARILNYIAQEDVPSAKRDRILAFYREENFEEIDLEIENKRAKID